MERFKRILVVVDEKTENRAVIERAVTVARRNRARLTIVNTVDELPRQVPRPVTPEPPAEAEGPVLDIIEEWPSNAGPPIKPEPASTLQEPVTDRPKEVEIPGKPPAVVIGERIVEDENRRLEQWVDFVRQRSIPVSGKMLRGKPFLQIIREVLGNEHDLVMKAAVGRGGLMEMLFGSTTMHLMRKCPCPVWVVKASQPEWYTRILAAVDPNPMDEERQALNFKIMDLATSLARLDQSELIVVHTWGFSHERSLRTRGFGRPSEVDRWVSDTRDLHKRWLAELLQPYDLEDLKHQVYLLKGEAGRLIPELAAEKEVYLIVMGAVARTGVAGLFLGNTAEKVLHQVDCSVLTAKPAGFVSPVGLDE